MTTLPLTTTDISRVRYSEGQYLTAADFQTEQDYHRRSIARHQLGGHTHGIVVGLDLVETPDPADATLVDVHLAPGLAIDGYGRQLVSLRRATLDASLFDAFVDDAHHEVWIAFDEIATRDAGPGWADCGDGAATRTVESYRIVVDPLDDVTEIVVEGAVAATPPAPAGTTEIPADRSVPYQEVPAEPPLARWLVKVGEVRWDGAALRFRPAATERLIAGRHYAGAVAAELLAPSGTLRVARRWEPADLDAEDFTTVDGRLRARGRINAERELWMEGLPIRFTLPLGSEPATKAMTLVRTGADELRLDLGDDAAVGTSLSIGAGTTTTALVQADGRVQLPVGPLQIGPGTALQEVELHDSSYGVGTQRGGVGDGTLYLRSARQFAWYTGGSHEPDQLDPGTGGVLRLVLDGEGTLDFGATTHQMIKLWSSGPTDGGYGIGVQNATLYFRSHFDVAWYRNGMHSDIRGSSGGGTVQMRLTEDATLQVTGAATTGGHLTVGAGSDAVVITRHVRGKQSGGDGIDHLYLNWGVARDVIVGGGGTSSGLEVTGPLRVRAAGAAAVESVVKVVRREAVVQNVGNAPGMWDVDFGGQLDEVFEAFVVVAGFGLTPTAFNATPPSHPSASNIPQYVWARCDGFNATHAWGRAMCSESDPTVAGDNHVAITVIAIGRNYV